VTAAAFFIVWLFLGILTAVVAAAKGRDWLTWFALGVAGGIFALAYVAFAPRGVPAPEESLGVRCLRAARKA
jgi:hypothetical protein